jgi:molybdenum cofactor cytidylyltransferase
MQLTQALGIQRHDVVTFTGAGGKSTVISRLARELATAGRRVVVTTTTHLAREQARAPHVVASRVGYLQGGVIEALRSGSVVTVTGELVEDGARWAGIAPDEVRVLRDIPGVDVVLVEGDGARRLPLKAPAEHEPVVPDCTTVLVPMMGALAFGQPLDEEHVHRPEIVEHFVPRGHTEPLGQRHVTAELAGTLLAHPAGGLKGRPDGARVVALINQCDAGSMNVARYVADLALQSRAVEAVLLAAAASEDEPVFERHVRISAVVLAAGASTRLGQLKQLLPWGPTGVPLLAHVVDQVRQARGLTEIYAVIGYRAEEITAAVRDRAIPLIWNQDWEQGQSASVRAGLRIVPNDIGAVLFVLCDQPGITPALVEALIQRHRETGKAVVAPQTAAGQRGTPTLWDRRTFHELMLLQGDTGGRALLEMRAERGEVAWVLWGNEILQDIDEPGDLPQT